MQIKNKPALMQAWVVQTESEPDFLLIMTAWKVRNTQTTVRIVVITIRKLNVILNSLLYLSMLQYRMIYILF